jgi:hypothetical protein
MPIRGRILANVHTIGTIACRLKIEELELKPLAIEMVSVVKSRSRNAQQYLIHP